MVAGKMIACGRYVIYYEAVVKPGNERNCDMLQILDKVEEKYLDYRSRTWCLSSGFRLGLRAKVAVI